MALLRVNADGSEPVLHCSAQPLEPVLQRVLQTQGPVIILLHGYKYLPASAHCPHKFLFAQQPRRELRQIISWPRHLGFGAKRQNKGVAICFGWAARGTVRGAYARAAEAGRAVAALCRNIQRIDPGREVHLLSHSMGARVALQALVHMEPGDAARLVLMAAAEFSFAAETALSSPAGRATNAVHVTSRENDLYDFLMERALWSTIPADRAMGTHLERLPNLRNVLLDDVDMLAALGRLGFRIAPPQRRICHWSPYLRPGVFRFYRALLSGDLDINLLDAALPPVKAGRWSRLKPSWNRPLTLPFLRGSSV